MKGGGYTEDIIQNLKDASCDGETITKICKLYENGQICDVVKVLRRQRCNLMMQLHESQRKVDCLDFLIRKMEKSQRLLQ